MSTPVKIILAVVLALIVLGVLKNLIVTALFYGLLALGAVALLGLVWRWLSRGGVGRAKISVPTARSAERQDENRAARELRELEKQIGGSATPTRPAQETEQPKQNLRVR